MLNHPIPTLQPITAQETTTLQPVAAITEITVVLQAAPITAGVEEIHPEAVAAMGEVTTVAIPETEELVEEDN